VNSLNKLLHIFILLPKLKLYLDNQNYLKNNKNYLINVEEQILSLALGMDICKCSSVFKKFVNIFLRSRLYFLLKKHNTSIKASTCNGSVSMNKKN
jgi:hypothetical protein